MTNTNERMPQDGMLTPIEQSAMCAFDNEADTKGLDAAAQGAWENATYYAEQDGHDVTEFKQTLLALYCGHIDACNCPYPGGIPEKNPHCYVHGDDTEVQHAS